MPLIDEKYDQTKIDRLRHFIHTNADKGTPKDYEILVDGLKVVARTNSPEEFDSFEDYLNEGTKKIKIVIYNGASPRNDQFVFTLLGQAKQELNGLDVDTKIKETISVQRKEWEAQLLQEKYDNLDKKHQQAEDYIDQLQNTIEEIRQKKFHVGDVNFGELASVMLEGVVRRNPQWISKLPGGEALAGVIAQDTKEIQQLPQSETNASFKRSEGVAGMSDEDKEWITLLKQMQQSFNEQEWKAVYGILEKLSQNRALIPTVIELLTENK